MKSQWFSRRILLSSCFLLKGRKDSPTMSKTRRFLREILVEMSHYGTDHPRRGTPWCAYRVCEPLGSARWCALPLERLNKPLEKRETEVCIASKNKYLFNLKALLNRRTYLRKIKINFHRKRCHRADLLKQGPS